MVEIGARAAPDDDPDARGSWDDPLRGSPVQVAAGLRRYWDLGMDHVRGELRPSCVESVSAFGRVIEALRTPG
jgi:hypothetical protein